MNSCQVHSSGSCPVDVPSCGPVTSHVTPVTSESTTVHVMTVTTETISCVMTETTAYVMRVLTKTTSCVMRMLTETKAHVMAVQIETSLVVTLHFKHMDRYSSI